MSLPISQNVNIIYSGAVTATTTTQMISAITGCMKLAGWTQTGTDTVWRSVSDGQGRFFEMEVLQNTTVSLSNQIQFAVYKSTKAADNNVLVNRGFQITTGSAYKIQATSFSIYTELNNNTLGQGNNAFAWQLCADPLTSGQLLNTILAGGHRNFAGTTASEASRFATAAIYYNGTSGSLDGIREFYSVLVNGSSSDIATFKGGRLFVMEDWISNSNSNDPLQGRPYALLLAGGNGVGGFEIPSGTGTITYTRVDAVSINGLWNYYIRSQ